MLFPLAENSLQEMKTKIIHEEFDNQEESTKNFLLHTFDVKRPVWLHFGNIPQQNRH